MNKYEIVSKRLKECAVYEGDCELCEYCGSGCDISTLMMAAAEIIDGYLHPKSGGDFVLDEVVEGCTVEVLKNRVTGEYSVGWYQGKREDLCHLEIRESEE